MWKGIRAAVRSTFGQASWSPPPQGPVAAYGEGPYVGLWPRRVGRETIWEPLHYGSDGHLLMAAPSRSGKGVTCLTWSLMTNRDSSIILDIKGELLATTGRARLEMGHEVKVLNPFNEPMRMGKSLGWPTHGFNPLARIDPASVFYVSEVDGLAAALLAHDGKAASHWIDSARAMTAGLIMQEVAAARRRGQVPALGWVRECIAMNDADFETTVQGIVASSECRAEVRDRLQGFTGLTNELRSVRSTAKTETAWLSDPVMDDVTARDDIDFAELKRKPMTVYVILPAALVSAGSPYSRFLRLVVQGAIEALIKTPRTSKRPVWLLIDEFFSLGNLPIIERMMSEGAGYGLQMQLVVQTLGQLKDLYRDNWETFIGNAAVKQFFAASDMTTAGYVSKLLGNFTAHTQSIGPRGDASYGETGRPLLRPEEVMGLPGNRQIVFLRGHPQPLMLGRAPYFDAQWGFAGRYDPNPYHVA